MQLALFPLPVFLLPGGRTRLSIFEPRYNRLVAESVSTKKGFGLCLPSDSKSVYEIGTRVEIFDFGQDKNGFLTIDIKGIERFTFNKITTDSDGLMHADIIPIESWQSIEMSEKYDAILTPLKDALVENPLYVEQVSTHSYDDLSWVCQRWLEILPIPTEKKYWLAKQTSLDPVIDIIRQNMK